VTEWVAVAAGLVGAAIGAAAAYVGPWRVQKRVERRQNISKIVAVRSAGVAWLDHLHRSLKRSAAGETVDRDEFDQKSEQLRAESRKSLAEVLEVGYDVIAGPLSDHFDRVEESVRQAIVQLDNFDVVNTEICEAWRVRKYYVDLFLLREKLKPEHHEWSPPPVS
jgi:hypothetical protein